MLQKKFPFPILLQLAFGLILISFSHLAISSEKTATITLDGKEYPYSVVQAGDNYNFKFNTKIPDDEIRLRIGRELLLNIFDDNSISKTHSAFYIKERARCYVYDSNWYTYSLCFLPNEFSNKKSERLWGFMTQIPNWKWLLTRFFLPALFIFGFVFYTFRNK